DLGEQLRLHPDALVSDPLGVRLSFADQRRQAFAEIGGRHLVEAVVDFTGIDQVLALAAADIDSVPLVAVEREAGDGQRLALGAGFLEPVVTPAGSVGARALSRPRPPARPCRRARTSLCRRPRNFR